jgi:hypothetical protein
VDRHHELKLEGLLDEIPVPIGTATVLLYTQPTLCGEGGVGGVKLLDRHLDSRLEETARRDTDTHWESYYCILNLPCLVREEWVVLNC